MCSDVCRAAQIFIHGVLYCYGHVLQDAAAAGAAMLFLPECFSFIGLAQTEVSTPLALQTEVLLS
jgi:hypothetical protein